MTETLRGIPGSLMNQCVQVQTPSVFQNKLCTALMCSLWFSTLLHSQHQLLDTKSCFDIKLKAAKRKDIMTFI